MVEGGTLLRCYTSQRGIEGSNPSSSASRVAICSINGKLRIGAGTPSGSYYTNEYTNAGSRVSSRP